MLKILTAYQAHPTLKNAQRVRAYERAHPMVSCMLSPDQLDLVADAIHHANRGGASIIVARDGGAWA